MSKEWNYNSNPSFSDCYIVSYHFENSQCNQKNMD